MRSVTGSIESERPLGAKEQLFHALHRWGAFINVQVLRISGAVTPDDLRRALDRLQEQHPLLRSHIVYGRPRLVNYFPYLLRPPRFRIAGTEPIPLSVVDWPEGELDELVERELRTPIPRGTRPRIRATLIHRSRDDAASAIILTFDHSIVDAYSVNRISRWLMRLLAGDGEIATRVPRPDRGLPPPLEARNPERPGVKAPPYIGPIRLPWSRQWTFARRRTRIYQTRLGRIQTAALYRDCNRAAVTVHGAICAAALKALSDHFGPGELTCLSTVSLRRTSTPKVPDHEVACHVDILRTGHRTEADFWGLAKEVSFALVVRIAHWRAAASVWKFPPLGRLLHEGLAGVWHGGRTDSLAISTVGETGLERAYGPYTLEQVTMAVGIHVRGPSLFILAYEHDGELNFCFCYPDPVMAPETVESVADRTIALLQRGGE